jgi:hypothetical protein
LELFGNKPSLIALTPINPIQTSFIRYSSDQISSGQTLSKRQTHSLPVQSAAGQPSWICRSNLTLVCHWQISKRHRNPEKLHLASNGSRIVGERRESSFVINRMHSLVRLFFNMSVILFKE